MRKDILRNSRVLAELGPAVQIQVDGILRQAGFTQIRHVADNRRILAAFDEYHPDIVLLDCTLPKVDVLSHLKQFRAHITEAEYLPILAVTSAHSRKEHEEALAFGAKDLIITPFERTEFLLRVCNLLETRWVHQHMESVVRERTRRLLDTQHELLRCLAAVADYRDGLTGLHGRRVGRIAGLIADQLQLRPQVVQHVSAAAALHDIGKIGVPDRILFKPGQLDSEEFECQKAHTTIGAEILGGFAFPILRMASQIARYHHEHWDGRGYEGLEGEDIPLPARITALADAFDVMLSERGYKSASPFKDVIAEIRRERGHHFDPACVDALLDLLTSGVVKLNEVLSLNGEDQPGRAHAAEAAAVPVTVFKGLP